MNTDAIQKSETLFGGRDAQALHEDGSVQGIKVRQLRLGEYERAFALIEDEIAFTAFCCSGSGVSPDPAGTGGGYERAWSLTLQPESYETLQLAAREVNEKGFFS